MTELVSQILTIILFFIYTYGLGYSLTRFITHISFEIFLLRIGLGMGAMVVLGLLLNLLHIPIYWPIFLGLAVSVPIFDLVRGRNSGWNELSRPAWQSLAVIVIMGVHLYLFLSGAFAYPWLEDDDPWFHAAGVKYIAMEKDVNPPQGYFQYLTPYPPGYDVVMAVLHQSASFSMRWVLKFFNSLIISLGLGFFFIFARTLLQDKNKALMATLFLACIPCYLSHFIWAHSLVVTLFFPTMYLILRSLKDQRFVVPASVSLAAIYLTQPTQPIKFAILIAGFALMYWLIYKVFPRVIIKIVALSILISMIWIAPTMMQVAKGMPLVLRACGVSWTQDQSITQYHPTTYNMYFKKDKEFGTIKRAMFDKEGGTASQKYSFWDFVVLEIEMNFMNNPYGFGWIFSMLTIGSLLLIFGFKEYSKDQQFYLVVLYVWLLICFLGVNSATFNLPVGLMPYRFWMLLAIPVALLSAETVAAFYNYISRDFMRKVVMVIIFGLVFAEAGFTKYQMINRIWNSGVCWATEREADLYSGLAKSFEPNTKVYSFIANDFVNGYDMYSDFWSESYRNELTDVFDVTLPELHRRLKKNQFEVLVIGERELSHFGKPDVIKKVNALNSNPNFKLVFNADQFYWVYLIL